MSLALNEVSKHEVDAALDRLQTSPLFERSAALLRLLRFLLQTAESTPELLRESYIATAFFNRDDTYDPRVDSIVRVNLRRLRQRLEEFYAGEGTNETVHISVPVGSYLPVVRRTPASDTQSEARGPALQQVLPPEALPEPVLAGAAEGAGSGSSEGVSRASGRGALWTATLLYCWAVLP